MKDHAFGIHAVAEILKQNPTAIERLFLQAGRLDQRAESILKRAESSGITVQRVARSELDQLVDGRHQGVIATLAGTRVQDQDLRWSEQQLLHAVEHNDQALILVLDGVTDPHNLGACLRSADAAGATAVVIPKDKSADITPTVRKVACGACATVPLVRVTNLARSLVALKESGIWLYGAAGEAETSLYEARARGPIALVMGAEGSGMRRLTREHCDFLIAIPMAGAVESLNVSVATGICLFELQRQR
ncbi:MAG: 23S rRNA (guanosine(2251)-2'-O)-methyltransferase RlmB, partial [Pseudomonadota bacterium]